MSRTLVLGAGLSIAVSQDLVEPMPTTDQLGNLVLERLHQKLHARRVPPQTFQNGRFETWLSRLAEPQPDLSDADNKENESLFLHITDEIYAVIQERQDAVFKNGFPPWFLTLLRLAHVERARLVTFNYDTLIEEAVRLARLIDLSGGTREVVDPVDLIRDIPPGIARAYGGLAMTSGGRASTFRLIKLHGSTDNYWVHGDGATITRIARAGRPDWPSRPPGSSPFIVPPAAGKSAFYDNPISKELWRTAAYALRSASHIALIGYSLPRTDLVTTGMLSEQLAGGRVSVDVVNIDPEPVVQTLNELGIPVGDVVRSIPEYVEGIEVT